MSAATILLVDDDQRFRRGCRRALVSDRCKVLEAADGEAALRIIQDRQGPLDLVITDLFMPRIGGYEVAEVLSIFRPELPVLGMTDDPGRADRRLPTLLKPFRVEELIEASRLMRQRAVEMRAHLAEKRERARAVRGMTDLVSVALELQRLDRINRKR